MQPVEKANYNMPTKKNGDQGVTGQNSGGGLPGKNNDLGGSSNGGVGSPGGNQGGAYQGNDKKKIPLIPELPDTNGGATAPEPLDVTVLAGPTKEPERKPLRNPELGGQYVQSGITGYAGVFIPLLALVMLFGVTVVA